MLKSRKKSGYTAERHVNVLSDPALNDVFIGESLSSRVSYYEIQCDDGEMVKQKSSGVIVCTGLMSPKSFPMNQNASKYIPGIPLTFQNF